MEGAAPTYETVVEVPVNRMVDRVVEVEKVVEVPVVRDRYRDQLIEVPVPVERIVEPSSRHRYFFHGTTCDISYISLLGCQ